VNSLSGDARCSSAFAEICENIRDFTVPNPMAVFLGCGALHFTGRICARCAPSSSSQKPRARRGQPHSGPLIEEAEEHGIQSIALHGIPDFLFPLWIPHR